ncbi:unnamed protein product [Clavelina lepadiformis]|uniref:Uncharacterized protein n=1 Tax=Clavelina lepadiformis TaxID=159417 RepID=A0ABP0GNZ8_CLALP
MGEGIVSQPTVNPRTYDMENAIKIYELTDFYLTFKEEPSIVLVLCWFHLTIVQDSKDQSTKQVIGVNVYAVVNENQSVKTNVQDIWNWNGLVKRFCING